MMGARSIVVPAAFWSAFSLVHAAAPAGSQAKPDKIVPARRRRWIVCIRTILVA
jgi:hypothetical protein